MTDGCGEMSAQVLMLGIGGEELSSEEVRLFRELQPGGFILFSRNMQSPEQVRALTDQLRELCMYEPLIAVDQEGGRVCRTASFAPSLPSAEVLGRAGMAALTARSGYLCGEMLSMLGINMNFAPVMDVNHFPDQQNSLAARCWGEDSQSVTSNVGPYLKPLRKQGILACGKHFPGMGRATCDPHFELPVVDISLDQMLNDDLIPFNVHMPYLDAIMMSHAYFPQLEVGAAEEQMLPASLSSAVVTGLLRHQLGFDRLVVCDDLDMDAIGKVHSLNSAVAAALRAGNDLALACHSFDQFAGLTEALEEVDAQLLFDAEARILKAKKKLRVLPSLEPKRWQRLLEAIDKLNESIPVEALSSELSPDQASPVTEY